MEYRETTLRCHEIYKGRIIRVHCDEVRLADGTESRREIVEHHGGVCVLPLDADDTVWCVRQFRYAYGESLLEIPAGKLEEGEAPLDCAMRELSEETGYTADRYVPLGCIYPSPGYCSERLHLYLATGLHRGEMHLDRGEFLDVEAHSLRELEELVMAGDIRDAKTVTAVLKTCLWLERGEKEEA